MGVTIHPGLAPAQRAEAAQLYWKAFGGKLGRVMGPEPKALKFIERVICPAHVLAALDGQGRVLGVIGFRTWRGAFVGGGFAELRAVYGPLGALWRSACLALLARDEEPRALVVDGLAVRDDRRGEGIGAALIEALCAEARTRGYGEVRLDVVAQNIRARALYERQGFLVVRRLQSRMTGWVFAFDTAFVMVRRL